MSKVVLANGVFDILHAGHIDYLELSRKQGDLLCVSVTRDRSVNKGEGRPIMPQAERVKILKALRCVSRVILVDSSLEALKKVQPNIFTKGDEYKRRIRKEDRAWCSENKCRIVFMPKTHSSTAIYARLRQG